MTKLFNILIRHKISPNQMYMLWGFKNGILPLNINTKQETYVLEEKKLVLNNQLTEQGEIILNDCINTYDIISKGINKEKMGDDYFSNIEKYNEMFPKIKLPTGKYARTNVKNLEPGFKWFFQNFKYSWETIFKATAMYLDEKEPSGYKYCRTSQYFIRKAMNDRSITSDLAEYCEIIDKGLDFDQPNQITENIF